MHGFISPWGMYFLSSVTCLTHIPLWWLGWPVDAEWYADLHVCTATPLPLYGHQDDLISGNDALVPCDCRWSTGMWYLPFCQYAKKTILGQKKNQHSLCLSLSVTSTLYAMTLKQVLLTFVILHNQKQSLYYHNLLLIAATERRPSTNRQLLPLNIWMEEYNHR